MESVKEIFKTRDGLNEKEAKNEVHRLQNDIMEIITNGSGYDEVEELLLDEGLEMDYVMDLLF